MNKANPLYIQDLNYILDSIEPGTIQNKSFLITGASGMIGLCLIDALMLYNRHGGNVSIFAVSRDWERAKSRLGEYFSDGHFHFIEQDVRQPFSPELNVDFIIPLASNTHPLAYSKYPIETIEINVKGIEYALQKAEECGAAVLYPSTVEIYGNARGEDDFMEDYTGQLDLSTARSCYTESKRVSEALCQSYLAEKMVSVKIARLCRVFGPTMQLSDTKASSQFILHALNGEDIVLKSKGNQFFSYIYVADVVAALLQILIHGENGIAYNVSNNDCDVHLKDFADYCARWSGKAVVYDLPSSTERKGFSIASRAILKNDKLRALGFSPVYAAENAIFRTLNILANKQYL